MFINRPGWKSMATLWEKSNGSSIGSKSELSTLVLFSLEEPAFPPRTSIPWKSCLFWIFGLFVSFPKIRLYKPVESLKISADLTADHEFYKKMGKMYTCNFHNFSLHTIYHFTIFETIYLLGNYALRETDLMRHLLSNFWTPNNSDFLRLQC